MQSFDRIKNFFGQYYLKMPRGAGTLFFIQIFSTLSFSVLYSTLVLYATNGLKLSDSLATGITASFIAFNYALHLIGGFIGGRYLSYRSLFCLGMIAQVIGCFLISINNVNNFYWGLSIFLGGSGLNVTCVNCMLTQLFDSNDKRRETAFLWNYSGMNVGFFVGFGISGYLQLQGAYRELFILSSLGNCIAVVITFLTWHSLKDIDTKLTKITGAKKRLAYFHGLMMILTLIFSLRWLLEHNVFSSNLILLGGVCMGLVMLYLAFLQKNEERNKMFAYLILALTSVVFWTLYQLAPMGFTLFIERNVDRHFLNYIIAPQWVQNINTIVIILGGPLLSYIFNILRDRNINITIPMQFSVALICIGIGFGILPIGIYFANGEGLVHFNWIAASFILQSLGELFISPIGYAMVGQFAPKNLQGIMMGTWLMITGVSATLSGYFSNLALGHTQSIDPLITNPTFSHTFGLLGMSSIVTGILLLFFVPFVLQLTQEKNILSKVPA